MERVLLSCDDFHVCKKTPCWRRRRVRAPPSGDHTRGMQCLRRVICLYVRESMRCDFVFRCMLFGVYQYCVLSFDLASVGEREAVFNGKQASANSVFWRRLRNMSCGLDVD